MKERPILFSGPMVRALLAGTKTQTRRAVKVQPWASCAIEEGMDGESPFVYSALTGDGPGHDVHEIRSPCRCPYGQPGERLWVRETHGFGGDAYAPDVHYRATHPDAPIQGRWLPSIHMRRIDSRILLEITGVRVERLQDINEADARAEGIEFFNDDQECGCRNYMDQSGKDWTLSPRKSFQSLWYSINDSRSWDANPWVWVIDFKRIEQPQTAH